MSVMPFRVELSVRRADELAIRIDGELEAAVGFLGKLFAPGQRPFVEGVIGRDEVRQLQLDGLRSGSGWKRCACEGGEPGQRDGSEQRHDIPP
jgi:hypothetical protein